jgi:hypothetical protein
VPELACEPDWPARGSRETIQAGPGWLGAPADVEPTVRSWDGAMTAPAADPERTPELADRLAAARRARFVGREAQRSQALDRFGLLRPFLEDGVPLAEIARQHKLPLRTLERWLHRYRQRGPAGLARSRG